jgi:hypothetical protein
VAADPARRRGVRHVYTDEQLRAFGAVPAEEKLRWLESMRQLLERALTPEKLELMQRFRRGDL